MAYPHDIADPELGLGRLETRSSQHGQGAPGGGLNLDATNMHRVSSSERAAILESLYRERRVLARARLMGTLSASDADYLDDLERYIDRWELEDQSVNSDSGEIWRELRAVAAQVLSLQASVERTRR